MKAICSIIALLTTAGLSTLDSAAGALAASAREARISACPGGGTGERAGQLDTTFGQAGTGIARLSFGAGDDGGFFDLDILGDTIVAGGWGMGGLGATRFRVARLTDAGAPDPSFGGSGMVTTGWASSSAERVYAVAVDHQRNGDILAMGSRDRFRSERSKIALARYNPDGSLDSSFGDSGKSLIELRGTTQILNGLVLRDDRILVVGKLDGYLLVARATANGALDTSFARPDGYWSPEMGDVSEAQAVAVDGRGRIVVVGSTSTASSGRDMVVLRFTANGTPDRAFGREGRVIAGDPGVDERAVAVALSPDGRIVVAGDGGPNGTQDFQVRSFLPDGAPDLAFGEAGVARPPITDGDDRAEDMVLLPGGDILVVGNRHDARATEPLVARYTCSGALDPSFGAGGVLRLDLGESGVAHAVRMYSDDRVLIGGADVAMTPGPGTYGVVARMWI